MADSKMEVRQSSGDGPMEFSSPAAQREFLLLHRNKHFIDSCLEDLDEAMWNEWSGDGDFSHSIPTAKLPSFLHGQFLKVLTNAGWRAEIGKDWILVDGNKCWSLVMGDANGSPKPPKTKGKRQ